jgi:GNAT superfamily N-acetyltransferase
MRVHPEVQRRGFGRAILLALEQRARELGYGRLVLDTTTRQQAAIALYQNNGFVQTGRTTVAGMATLLFAKRLDPI